MKSKRIIPAMDPQQREQQMIGLAMDLAQRQLEEGTATSQVITHFLQLATIQERLKNEKLQSDLRVAEAKIKALEAQETGQELYSNALQAFRSYQGTVFQQGGFDE